MTTPTYEAIQEVVKYFDAECHSKKQDAERFYATAADRGYYEYICRMHETAKQMQARIVDSNWKSFFFESNRFFDRISSMEDWNKLRAAFPDRSDEDLLSAKEATYGGFISKTERDEHPKYGFRIECDGERTLNDFFKENNMVLLKG